MKGNVGMESHMLFYLQACPRVHPFCANRSHEVRDLKLVYLKTSMPMYFPKRHRGPPAAPLPHFEGIWSLSLKGLSSYYIS